jgi:asparagine N-glycosylation enzyme membrane subunit Stt3
MLLLLFALVLVLLVLLLLLKIAGIIITIIAVCTKRTFFHHLLAWGMGIPSLSLSLSPPRFNLAKLPKITLSNKVVLT